MNAGIQVVSSADIPATMTVITVLGPVLLQAAITAPGLGSVPQPAGITTPGLVHLLVVITMDIATAKVEKRTTIFKDNA